MKKISLNLGDGGIQKWLAMHAEKLVLGVACLMVVLFVYWGASLETYSKTPKELSNVASSATQHIQRDSSQEIVAQLPPEAFTAVSHQRIPQDDAFVGPMIVPKKSSLAMLRRDPQLFPPIKLEVFGAMGPMMVRSEATRVDPFENDEAAVFPAPEETPRRRTTRSDEEEDTPLLERTPVTTATRKVLKRSFLSSLPGIDPQRVAGGYAESKAMIAINALVEYKRQADEFKSALYGGSTTAGEMEKPNYLVFVLERAEIVDGQQQPWQRVSHTSAAKMGETLYGTELPELARDEYLLLDKITMKIPPILMVDESKFAIHSEIPRKGDIGTGETTPESPEQLRSTEPLPTPDIVPIQPKSGTDSAHASEQTQTPTKPEDTLLTEYKLLRAYDFNVQPGKTYVYRVQVWLEDPNHPQQELTDKMRERPFAPSVIQRLMDVAEKEKTQNRRIWYRESPWSEPSEPVSVPQLSTMLAGGVTPGRSTTINGVEVELDPLTGQLLQVEWDRQRAVPAAGLLNVYRGSSLEATVDVDVMKPIDQELVTVKNYQFQGDGVVVDMRGGRKLPTSSKDMDLHSPGEFAVVDQQGNLQVQNELDDMAGYRRYLFLDAIDENRFGEVNREPSEEGGAHGLLDGHGLLEPRDEREREPRSRGR